MNVNLEPDLLGSCASNEIIYILKSKKEVSSRKEKLRLLTSTFLVYRDTENERGSHPAR